MKRLAIRAAIVLTLCLLVYFFPLFRTVPLETARAERQAEKFDPKAFATEFWISELPAAADSAIEMPILLAAIRKDAEAAKTSYARTLGIGDTYYYHVRGNGRIIGNGNGDEKVIRLVIDEAADGAQVEIPTGPVFSNAVRDATGLIKVSSFASSRDFNNISRELNIIVEQSVLPSLRKDARDGLQIRFVGCVEIDGEQEHPIPLTIVPVTVEFVE